MADFTVETYSRRRLEGMIALYNQETEHEPHIARLTPDLFTALVEAKSYFDPSSLFVALERGRVVGWVHACMAPTSEPWQEAGRVVARIRMLIFPQDRLKVGGTLVAAATDWLKPRGATEIEAMHPAWGYPFYRGLWLGGEPMGPVTMPHVQLALEVAGYKHDVESIMMTAAMKSGPPDAAWADPVELVTAPAEMAHDGMRQSWVGFDPMRTRVLLKGQEVGAIGWAVLPHVSERLGAPCLNIWSLGVHEQHRRRGIGLALVRVAARRGYESGARFCSVGTQLWNAPAHATYAAAGFLPYRIVVGRKLTLQQDP